MRSVQVVTEKGLEQAVAIFVPADTVLKELCVFRQTDGSPILYKEMK